jgi:RNA ligase
MNKLEIKILNKYFDDGLLIKQKHPTKPLIIWNYSQKCQYDRCWNETLLQCRGLVTNSKGKIIARPFKKFFNVHEHEECDFLPPIPKDNSFQAFEKLDGSLINLFNYKDEWIVASRGSFESDQAKWAKEILDKKGLIAHDDATKSSMWNNLNKKYTYIFELIVPQNRIVVNYGKMEDVVLLGVIKTEDGDELSYGDIKMKYGDIFTIVKRYNGVSDFDKLKETFQDDVNEGLVIKLGKERYKLKWDEYVRLHKIVTNISNKDIWNHLKEGIPFDKMLEKVPDEFYSWVKKTRADLETQYANIETESLKLFLNVYNELGASFIIKKEFALRVKDIEYSNILFNMYDGKDYKKTIWKMIKPVYSRPFKDDIRK